MSLSGVQTSSPNITRPADSGNCDECASNVIFVTKYTAEGSSILKDDLKTSQIVTEIFCHVSLYLYIYTYILYIITAYYYIIIPNLSFLDDIVSNLWSRTRTDGHLGYDCIP